MSNTATPRQYSYLTTLLSERDPQVTGVTSIPDLIDQLQQAGATTVDVSKLIDGVMALPRRPRQAQAVSAPRPNKYSGKCVNCGDFIPAGGGTFEKRAGRWVVLHIGTCPRDETFDRQGVGDGHYATPSRTGHNDLDFWRVDADDEGRDRVRRVIGGHPDQPVRASEAEQAIAAILAYGVEEARTLYGQTIGQCWVCNRHLTREYSRHMGYGPDCADNLGLPFDMVAYNASAEA